MILWGGTSDKGGLGTHLDGVVDEHRSSHELQMGFHHVPHRMMSLHARSRLLPTFTRNTQPVCVLLSDTLIHGDDRLLRRTRVGSRTLSFGVRVGRTWHILWRYPNGGSVGRDFVPTR